LKRIRCLKKGVTHDSHLKMSKPTKAEVLSKLRGRYVRAGQQPCGKLLVASPATLTVRPVCWQAGRTGPAGRE
jgi:hypothetical protein